MQLNSAGLFETSGEKVHTKLQSGQQPFLMLFYDLAENKMRVIDRKAGEKVEPSLLATPTARCGNECGDSEPSQAQQSLHSSARERKDVDSWDR